MFGNNRRFPVDPFKRLLMVEFSPYTEISEILSSSRTHRLHDAELTGSDFTSGIVGAGKSRTAKAAWIHWTSVGRPRSASFEPPAPRELRRRLWCLRCDEKHKQ